MSHEGSRELEEKKTPKPSAGPYDGGRQGRARTHRHGQPLGPWPLGFGLLLDRFRGSQGQGPPSSAALPHVLVS
jgi:hypothetical protein